MGTVFVSRGDNIKDKGRNIVVKSLVIQKELGQKAKFLAVRTMVLPVQLKDRQITLAVNFLSRRFSTRAFRLVVTKGPYLSHVRETVFANVQCLQVTVSLGKGTVVPSLHFPATHDYLFNILDLCCFFVFAFKGCQGWIPRVPMPVTTGNGKAAIAIGCRGRRLGVCGIFGRQSDTRNSRIGSRTAPSTKDRASILVSWLLFHFSPYQRVELELVKCDPFVKTAVILR